MQSHHAVTAGAAGAPPARLSSAAWAPLVPTLGLAALTLLEPVRQHGSLRLSVLGAAGALAAWHVLLLAVARRGDRPLSMTVAVRAQHYLQACAQGSVLLYWGWYWREVYDAAPLIAAQLLFAYGVDLLLAWSRRDTYTLGFGPFPVIFSINLFLWFKPDWFYFQFLLIALGFAAKGLIRWDREGRRVHIFNPSSFPLAVFSLALLLTGRSDLTWGREIATTQFYPPYMYLALFLIGLPGQYVFGVTSMTLSAVATTYLFGLTYTAITGIYFFYDAYIPIAVFLGMHLLFTDPSTSPRTELGRLLFGALYGLSTIALYQLLGAAGLPTFYDKLLPVPILNLSVLLLDRLARSGWVHAVDPAALGAGLAPRRRHLAYMAVWAMVFAGMSATGGVGDDHPGQWLPFWQRACEDDRPHACRYLGDVQAGFCGRGSGWACYERGVLQARLAGDVAGAAQWLERGCALGFAPACTDPATAAAAAALPRTAPPPSDYPIVLRGSKGPVTGQSPEALRDLACRQGWANACG